VAAVEQNQRAGKPAIVVGDEAQPHRDFLGLLPEVLARYSQWPFRAADQNLALTDGRVPLPMIKRPGSLAWT
jgi:hypothetical protein